MAEAVTALDASNHLPNRIGLIFSVKPYFKWMLRETWC
jgi:hypothetical protein